MDTSGQTTSGGMIASDKVEGTSVYDPRGNSLGSIKRLIIEKASGRTGYAVMTFGGFLGMGADEFAIPWGKLKYDVSLGGYRVDITEAQLKGSPSFSRNSDYNWSDRNRDKELYDYWNVPPYWGI
jgi:hypothetical protein